MGQLALDTRSALRALLRRPAFTAAFILTVALGVGASSSIFALVNAVLLKPLPFPEPQRLALLWSSNVQQGFDSYPLSPPDYFDYKERAASFQDLAVYRVTSGSLVGGGDAERVKTAEVSPGFFGIVGVGPALGRAFRPDENEPSNRRVAILSNGLWRSRYGADPGVVGKTLQLNDETYQIIGVMPAGFRFLDESTQLWVPRAFQPAEKTERTRSLRIYTVVGRLKPGVTPEKAQAELGTIAANLERAHPDDNKGWGVRMVTLRDQTVGHIRRTLLVLQGAVAFLLLMSCANLANLILVRAVSREREISIRTALGANRGRLVRLLLTESLLPTLAGGALGLLVAGWMVRVISLSYGSMIPRADEVGVDSRVILLSLLLTVLVSLVGLLPLRHAARVPLIETLKDRGASAAGVHSQRLRDLMVSLQVAAALVLLIGTVLMVRSLERLRSVDPGFTVHNVLKADLTLPRQTPEPEQQAFIHSAVAALAAVSGVRAAGATTTLPMAGQESLDLSFEAEGLPVPAGGLPEAGFDAVSPGYFSAMGIAVLSGRGFQGSDRMGSVPVAVINETLARQLWPGRSPLNHRIRLDMGKEKPRLIVGVVNDVLHSGLDTKPRAEIYVPHEQFAFPTMTLVVRTEGDPAAVAPAVREAIRRLNPNLPLADVETMEQVLAGSLLKSNFVLIVLGTFSFLALALATMGLYSIMSYSVTERTQEIGVRMAIGADADDVLKMMLIRGLKLTGAGIVIGIVVALWMARILESQLFEIKGSDPTTYVLVTVLLVGIAFVATWLPARRASRIDPVTALQYE